MSFDPEQMTLENESPRETDVCGRMVPVIPGPRSVVTFTGGANGPEEAGRFAFWFAAYRAMPGGGYLGHTGRGAEHGEPGERFNRHPEDPVYDKVRSDLASCLFVMPAPAPVIEAWLRSHPRDAAFATEADVEGVRYLVRECALIRD